MTSAITTTEPRATERAIWTEEQEALILRTFLGGASRDQAAALLEVARVRRLCPFRRHIFFVKRYDRQAGQDVWSFQVSIDGLRAKAEESGVYAGQDEITTATDDNGRPVMSRCVVWRTDKTRGFVGVARWSEFAQMKDGRPTAMWASKPFLMLEKCAEAMALRRAFPELGGAYMAEEMPEADHHEPPRPTWNEYPKKMLRAVAEADITPGHPIAPSPPPSAPAPPDSAEGTPPMEAELIRQLFEAAEPGSPEWAAAKERRAKAAKDRTITQREHAELGELARRRAEEHAAKVAPPAAAEPPPGPERDDSSETFRAIETAYRTATTRAQLAEVDNLCTAALTDSRITRTQGKALIAARKVAETRIAKTEQPTREPGEEG